MIPSHSLCWEIHKEETSAQTTMMDYGSQLQTYPRADQRAQVERMYDCVCEGGHVHVEASQASYVSFDRLDEPWPSQTLCEIVLVLF